MESSDTGYRDGGDEQREPIEIDWENANVSLPCNGLVSQSSLTSPEMCSYNITFPLGDNAPDHVVCPRCGVRYFVTRQAREEMRQMVQTGKGEVRMQFLSFSPSPKEL